MKRKGKSKEDAIIVTASNEELGVDAEYQVLADMLGVENVDWEVKLQTALIENNKTYDILTVNANENVYTLWFYITSFYGKLKREL